MFEAPTIAYDLTDATWEIVIMLTISFLMGWFFRYLWSMRGVEMPEMKQFYETPPAATPALPTRPEKYVRFREDDLKIVEGIGPKIEELLKTHGITTWQILAQTPPSTLKTILVSGGERFQMHDPSSWPDQVALALENRWDELAEFQTLMAGGRVR